MVFKTESEEGISYCIRAISSKGNAANSVV